MLQCIVVVGQWVVVYVLDATYGREAVEGAGRMPPVVFLDEG